MANDKRVSSAEIAAIINRLKNGPIQHDAGQVTVPLPENILFLEEQPEQQAQPEPIDWTSLNNSD